MGRQRRRSDSGLGLQAYAGPKSASSRLRYRVPGAARCMIYIMRRTQLYLDDSLWEALHARARSRKTTISELVREAARERYLNKGDEQRKAMQEFVGS